MNRLLPLARREWLQHRFAWSLLLLVPAGLAALFAAFGSIHTDADELAVIGGELAALLAFGTMVAMPTILLAIFWIASCVMMAGLARRDHGDRSIEFWMSLPTPHAASLATPLVLHMIVVPMAALLVGTLLAVPLSALAVSRLAGLDTWTQLPWGELIGAVGAIVLRLAVGLPLATLWLLPLLLLVVLFGAWFKRWGVVILAVSLGIGANVLDRLTGHPIVSPVVETLLGNAARAMFGAEGMGVHVGKEQSPLAAIGALRDQAFSTLGEAMAGLATAPFLGALLASALLFVALVDWRRRGAGISS